MIFRRDSSAPREQELLAQLSEANRLVIGDLVVPIPAWARTYCETHPHYEPGPDGMITAELGVRSTVDRLVALYTCWARRDGWTLDRGEPHDFAFEGHVVSEGAHRLRVTKGMRRFDIVVGQWTRGDVIVRVQVHGPRAVYELGTSETPPRLPAVTRSQPAALVVSEPLEEPGALAYDRGLVYVCDRDRVRVIDPTTRRIWAVPVDVASPAAIAVDNQALFVADRAGTVRRLDLASDEVSVVARDLCSNNPRFRTVALAVLFGRVYVVGALGNLVVIEPSGASREIAKEGVLAAPERGWQVEGLTAAGGALYAADGSGRVYAIDPTTEQVRKLADTPLNAHGITSDGDAVYVGHCGAITRIGIADGTLEQIIGPLPRRRGSFELGGVMADGIDGIGAVVQAESFAWDGAGGTYFVDDRGVGRGALRWLDLRRGYLVTVLGRAIESSG